MKLKSVAELNIKLANRMIAAFTAVVAVFLIAAPAFTTRAAGAFDEKITLYHWKRVYTQDDIPTGGDHYFMLVWNANGQEYYSCGSMVDENLAWCNMTSVYRDIATFDDEFYTYTPCGAWTLQYADRDTGNHVKRVRIKNPAGQYMHCNTQRNSAGVAEKATMGWSDIKGDPISIATSECKGAYGSSTYKDHVQVFFNVSNGADAELIPLFNKDPSFLTMRQNTSCDLYDFVMYVATKETNNAIGDYTVTSGKTLQIPDTTILKPGCTLKVENGGTLSISGEFYNNGTINNKGTVILQKNARIVSMYGCADDYPAAGSIYCEGTGTATSDLIVMSGAAIIQPSKYAVFDLVNASVVNYGLIFAPDKIYLSSTSFDNKSGKGAVCTGYNLSVRRAPYSAIEFTGKNDGSLLGLNFTVSAIRTLNKQIPLMDNTYFKTGKSRVISAGSFDLFNSDDTSKVIYY